MKIIPPIIITDAMLTSSNVAENDYAVWNSGTSYVTGNNVILTTGYHKIYIALQASTNKNPATEPTYWEEVGPTNRWKMFDEAAQIATSNSASIVVELTPGVIANSLACVNVVGDSAHVRVTDPTAGIVYDQDIDLKDLSGINGFYDWFFSPLAFITSFALIDLPAYPAATIKLTLNNSAGNAQIGGLVIGRLRELGIDGVAEWGTSLGVSDYSQKVVDDTTGAVTISRRKYAKTVDYKAKLQTNRVKYVSNILNENLSTPIILIGYEGMQETIIYGFYNNWDISLDDEGYSELTLQAEELA